MEEENSHKSICETVNLFLRSCFHLDFPQQYIFQEAPTTIVGNSNSLINVSFKFKLQKNPKVVKSIALSQFFINLGFYLQPKAIQCSCLSIFCRYSLDQFKWRHAQARIYENLTQVPPRLTRNLQKERLLKWLCDSNFKKLQFRTLLSQVTHHYNP